MAVQGPELNIDVNVNTGNALNVIKDFASQLADIRNKATIQVDFKTIGQRSAQKTKEAVEAIQHEVDELNRTGIKLNFETTDKLDQFVRDIESVDAALGKLSDKHSTMNIFNGLVENATETQKTFNTKMKTLRNAISDIYAKLQNEESGLASTFQDIDIKIQLTGYDDNIAKLRELRETINSIKSGDINVDTGKVKASNKVADKNTAKATLERAIESACSALDAFTASIKNATIVPSKKGNIPSGMGDFARELVLLSQAMAVAKPPEGIDLALKSIHDQFTLIASAANQLNRALTGTDVNINNKTKQIKDFSSQRRTTIGNLIKNNIDSVGINKGASIKSLEEFSDELKKVLEKTSKDIPIVLRLDIARFREDVKKLKGIVDKTISTKRFKPELRLDITKVRASIRKIREAINDPKVSTIKIKAQIKDATNSIKSLIASLAPLTTLVDKEIKIKADASQFNTVVDKAAEKLKALSDITVNINSNINDIVDDNGNIKRKPKDENAKYHSWLMYLQSNPVGSGKSDRGNSTVGKRLSTVNSLRQALALGDSNPSDPNAFRVSDKARAYLNEQFALLSKLKEELRSTMKMQEALAQSKVDSARRKSDVEAAFKEQDALDKLVSQYNKADEEIAKRKAQEQKKVREEDEAAQKKARETKLAADKSWWEQELKRQDALKSKKAELNRIQLLYNGELSRQNDLLKYGVSLTQKQIDDGERRLEQLKQRYVVAGGKESDLEDSELKKNYGNSAKVYNQQTNVANALAWKEHYYTTANEKVGALTSSLERLYTELNRNPGNGGLKSSINALNSELRDAQKEAKQTREQMDRLNPNNITKGWGHKIRWIGGAFGFYETYDFLRQFGETITGVDEAMQNLVTVMPAINPTIESNRAAWDGHRKALEDEQTALINVASKYGSLVEDVIESARLWGRMYKDVNTVNILADQSAKLAIADNFALEDSTKAVEAAMFQFGMQAESAADALAYSNRIVDAYTILSHKAGVTAQDLAAGVERSGAVAHQAGMDFEFLTSLIAQGTRSTALSGLTNTSPFMLETA